MIFGIIWWLKPFFTVLNVDNIFMDVEHEYCMYVL